MNSPSFESNQPIITKVDDGNLPPATTPSEPSSPHKTPQLGFNSKQIRVILASLFLVLLVIGGGTAFYLSQLNQDIRNQAAGPMYGACPPGVGGGATDLECNSTGGGECSGVESCHLPGGYDDCEPLPGSNLCLYSYNGGQCTAACPDTMGGDAKRCLCNNGVWTIGKGSSCDLICKCSGNDCPGCTTTPTPNRDRTPTPTSTLITITPTRTPTPSRTPSHTPTPTVTPTGSVTPTPSDGPSPTPSSSPTPTPPVTGPQCHDIRMFQPGGTEITGNMDQTLRPGESAVQFRCSATGGTPNRYEFRVLRPDGQIEDGDTNPALQAVGAVTGEYLLTQSGTYYAQCRICTATECHPYEALPVFAVGCQSDDDCQTNEYCYQPPMPTCPPGQSCAQVMPPKECRAQEASN